MEQEQAFDNVTAFDMLHTTNDIQMLKVIGPLIPVKKQLQFSVMIKMLELRHVLATQKECANAPLKAAQLDDGSAAYDLEELDKIFEQLSKYAPKESKERFNQFSRMKSSMEKMREMLSIMDVMNFTQANEGETNNNTANFNEQVKNMLSKEQLAMYEKFKDMANMEENL